MKTFYLIQSITSDSQMTSIINDGVIEAYTYQIENTFIHTYGSDQVVYTKDELVYWDASINRFRQFSISSHKIYTSISEAINALQLTLETQLNDKMPMSGWESSKLSFQNWAINWFRDLASGIGSQSSSKVSINENDSNPDHLAYKISEGNGIVFEIIDTDYGKSIKIGFNGSLLAPKIEEGNWFIFNYSTQQYEDTGVPASGTPGPQGEIGPQGPQGAIGPRDIDGNCYLKALSNFDANNVNVLSNYTMIAEHWQEIVLTNGVITIPTKVKYVNFNLNILQDTGEYDHTYATSRFVLRSVLTDEIVAESIGIQPTGTNKIQSSIVTNINADLFGREFLLQWDPTKSSSLSYEEGSALITLSINAITGAMGPQGDRGSDGTNGADGSQGAEGPQGSQGPQGAPGSNEPGTPTISLVETFPVGLGNMGISVPLVSANQESQEVFIFPMNLKPGTLVGLDSRFCSFGPSAQHPIRMTLGIYGLDSNKLNGNSHLIGGFHINEVQSEIFTFDPIEIPSYTGYMVLMCIGCSQSNSAAMLAVSAPNWNTSGSNSTDYYSISQALSPDLPASSLPAELGSLTRNQGSYVSPYSLRSDTGYMTFQSFTPIPYLLAKISS